MLQQVIIGLVDRLQYTQDGPNKLHPTKCIISMQPFKTKLNGFHLNVISVSRYKNKNIRLKFYVVAKYYFGKM